MTDIEDNIPAQWIAHFPWPKRDGNKYDRGHAVIAGGGAFSAGATKLAAFCALRSGAGLVSVACDAASLPIYAASFQAIMTKEARTVPAFTALIKDPRVTAVLLGPGMGVTARSKALVTASLKLKKSTVLDADALSCFAKDPKTLFALIQAPTLLTPHEGEFKRLFGSLITSSERVTRAKEAAKLSGAVVILKGNETVIAAPDGRVAINHNAPPALATAGAGDSLAGICTGLLAQGMPLFEAACAGVWMHADAASRFGPGLIADDLAELLPKTLAFLASQRG